MASSSTGFANSYNGDDAQHLLRHLNETRDPYSETTRHAEHLESCLEATQVTLSAAEGETSAVHDMLAAADVRVAGSSLRL